MVGKKQYPSDKQDQFMVRLPEGMRLQIKEAALKSGRSMNAEIVARLVASFGRRDHVELPEHLAKRIAAEAAANGRTMRYEIFRTLIDKYPVPDYVAIEEELTNALMARPLDQFQAAGIVRRILRRILEVEGDDSVDVEDFAGADPALYLDTGDR